MAIFSPVIPACEEHAGSGGTHAQNHTRNGAECAVTLRCNWEARHDLVADLLGNRRPWPHGVWADPPRATAASIRPFPDAGITVGDSITYDHALVDVTYSTREEVDVISESLEPTVEFLRLDYRNFRWEGAGGRPLKEDEAPGKVYKSLNLVRTHHAVEPPLPISLLDLIGYVNDVEYFSALLGLTFPAETLLFQPPIPSRTVTSLGSRAFNLQMRFAYKPNGWNVFWRAESGIWERMYYKDNLTSYYNYPLGDFSDFLF